MVGENLTLKGEAGTNLVGSLVEVLGVEGGTKTESDAGAEEDVVGESGNTTVVNLGLYTSLLAISFCIFLVACNFNFCLLQKQWN